MGKEPQPASLLPPPPCIGKIDDDGDIPKPSEMKIVGEEEEGDELESDLSVADSGVEQEAPVEDPHPLGNLIRVCGRGGERREHYEAFAYDGSLFSLVSLLIFNLLLLLLIG